MARNLWVRCQECGEKMFSDGDVIYCGCPEFRDKNGRVRLQDGPAVPRPRKPSLDDYDEISDGIVH